MTKVRFLEHGVEIEVPVGTTLLKAAKLSLRRLIEFQSQDDAYTPAQVRFLRSKTDAELSSLALQKVL